MLSAVPGPFALFDAGLVLTPKVQSFLRTNPWIGRNRLAP